MIELTTYYKNIKRACAAESELPYSLGLIVGLMALVSVFLVGPFSRTVTIVGFSYRVDVENLAHVP
ncbi:MAG: hypothetical protein V8Q27_05130 [Eubacteriales bacterium]